LLQVGPDQWALRVPFGKLHTERLVPADPEVRRIVARMLTLRALAPPTLLAKSQGLLSPRRVSRRALYFHLRPALRRAAKRAHCAGQVMPHRLRHSYSTEMLRLGVSLPALMRLLGHKDIRMTLRYVQVTQQDLQREYHKARQNAAQRHRLPTLSVPKGIIHADLPKSAKRWRLPAISWRWLVASSTMKKLSASCNASTGDSSPSLHNSSTSPQPKNEERLAGQVARNFTKTYIQASWLNQIEIYFSIIQSKAPPRTPSGLDVVAEQPQGFRCTMNRPPSPSSGGS